MSDKRKRHVILSWALIAVVWIIDYLVASFIVRRTDKLIQEERQVLFDYNTFEYL